MGDDRQQFTRQYGRLRREPTQTRSVKDVKETVLRQTKRYMIKPKKRFEYYQRAGLSSEQAWQVEKDVRPVRKKIDTKQRELSSAQHIKEKEATTKQLLKARELVKSNVYKQRYGQAHHLHRIEAELYRRSGYDVGPSDVEAVYQYEYDISRATRRQQKAPKTLTPRSQEIISKRQDLSPSELRSQFETLRGRPKERKRALAQLRKAKAVDVAVESYAEALPEKRRATFKADVRAEMGVALAGERMREQTMEKKVSLRNQQTFKDQSKKLGVDGRKKDPQLYMAAPTSFGILTPRGLQERTRLGDRGAIRDSSLGFDNGRLQGKRLSKKETLKAGVKALPTAAGRLAVGVGKDVVSGFSYVNPTLRYSLRKKVKKETREKYGFFFKPKVGRAAIGIATVAAPVLVSTKIITGAGTGIGGYTGTKAFKARDPEALAESAIIAAPGLGKGTGFAARKLAPFRKSYVTPKQAKAAGVKFVPQVTEPTPLKKLQALEGKRGVQVHTTAVPKRQFDPARAGGELLEARPESAGPTRRQMEQFSFYASSEGQAYGGYVGAYSKDLSVPTKTEFRLLQPRRRALVFREEVVPSPIRSTVKETVRAQQRTPQAAFRVAPENIFGMSEEGQVVAATAGKRVRLKTGEQRVFAPETKTPGATVIETYPGTRVQARKGPLTGKFTYFEVQKPFKPSKSPRIDKLRLAAREKFGTGKEYYKFKFEEVELAAVSTKAPKSTLGKPTRLRKPKKRYKTPSRQTRYITPQSLAKYSSLAALSSPRSLARSTSSPFASKGKSPFTSSARSVSAPSRITSPFTSSGLSRSTSYATSYLASTAGSPFSGFSGGSSYAPPIVSPPATTRTKGGLRIDFLKAKRGFDLGPQPIGYKASLTAETFGLKATKKVTKKQALAQKISGLEVRPLIPKSKRTKKSGRKKKKRK